MYEGLRPIKYIFIINAWRSIDHEMAGKCGEGIYLQRMPDSSIIITTQSVKCQQAVKQLSICKPILNRLVIPARDRAHDAPLTLTLNLNSSHRPLISHPIPSSDRSLVSHCPNETTRILKQNADAHPDSISVQIKYADALAADYPIQAIAFMKRLYNKNPCIAYCNWLVSHCPNETTRILKQYLNAHPDSTLAQAKYAAGVRRITGRISG